MIHILTKHNSIINHFIAEIRNKAVQQDRLRFRRNLERIGEMMAYELSKSLEYKPDEVETPLGIAETHLLVEQPVLITIVRAGIPFHQGFLNIFDQADSGFIAAFRHTKKSGEFEIHKKYDSTPNLDNKVVVIIDTMLATGKSLVLCCKELLAEYNIQELHIATIIASEEGIQHVRVFIPEANIWVADVDKELTIKSYIVPGLGDAGDLCYGSKY